MANQPDSSTGMEINREPTAQYHLPGATALIAVAILAAAFLLISPPEGQTFIGALEWKPGSWLQRIVQAQSLGDRLHTARGTEIKDFAAHIGAGVVLLLLAAHFWRREPFSVWRTAPDRNALWAVTFLVSWVVLSFLSTAWAGEPDTALGQASLYALNLGWAIGLAGMLRQRDVAHVVNGYVAISAAAALLCIWYFHERNPFHRPGFPVGNPNTMAASIVPATLLCMSMIGRSVWEWHRRREPLRPAALLTASAMLALLLWCLWLTNSRGALLGLGVGCFSLFFLLSGRRGRVIAAGAGLVLLVTASIWVYSHSGDTAMGRGASVRARFYYWRYAVLLWEQRPLFGHGAGAYTRLANQYSLRDRALDPAAFADADWTAHAHNELFEIFVEIGLIGGVTFVAGMLASLLAILGLMRRRPPPILRWRIAAIGAGILALIADSLVSPALRLAVVPLVLYTLLGSLWAICREQAESENSTDHLLEQQGIRAKRSIPAGVLAVCAAGWAIWAAGSNWSGVAAEYRAMRESGSDSATANYESCIASNTIARNRLLDPVRRLFADERDLRFRHEQTLQAFLALTAPAETVMLHDRPDPEKLARACEALYQAALRLDARAPTLGRTLATAARAAEMLSVLHRPAQDGTATEWYQRAERAWRNHRLRFLTDEEALLSLALNYPGSLTMRISYLRDALRNGFPTPEWRRALETLSATRGFEPDLARFTHAVGPIDPRTDAESILLSFAPEAYRLHALFAASRGKPEQSRASITRAVELYAAVKIRFPRLLSIALAEQADYELLADLQDGPARAAGLLDRAIAELPKIQQQQFARLAEPFRYRRLAVLAVAGQQDEAQRVATQLGGGPPRTVTAAACLQLAQRLSELTPTACAAAERFLEHATRLTPNDPAAWHARLANLARCERYDALTACWSAAAEALSKPQCDDLLERLGDAFPAARPYLPGRE